MKQLLDNISLELKAILNDRCHRHAYSQDEQIFAEGESASFLPIVASGAVKMIRSPEIGKEVIIGIFRDGEMFAIPPVFDGGPYPASAYAIKSTSLLQLDRSEFLRLLHESSEFAFAVISWTCEMLREKTATIRNLATASPEHRIGTVLVKLAEEGGSALPVRIGVRRKDIAEMANLTTETTIRVIRRFAEQKLVRIVHGKIMIDETKPLQDLLRF